MGPLNAKANRGRILKINDFRDSFFLSTTAKSGKTRHSALDYSLDLISDRGMLDYSYLCTTKIHAKYTDRYSQNSKKKHEGVRTLGKFGLLRVILPNSAIRVPPYAYTYLIYNRDIPLISTCWLIRLGHSQSSFFKQWIDISLNEVFAVFQTQELHDL